MKKGNTKFKPKMRREQKPNKMLEIDTKEQQ